MDLGLRGDIHTLGGLIEQEQPRGQAQPLPEQDLLLVAATERKERLVVGVARLDLQALKPPGGLAELQPIAEPAAPPERGQAAEREVLRAVSPEMLPASRRSAGR